MYLFSQLPPFLQSITSSSIVRYTLNRHLIIHTHKKTLKLCLSFRKHHCKLGIQNMSTLVMCALTVSWSWVFQGFLVHLSQLLTCDLLMAAIDLIFLRFPDLLTVVANFINFLPCFMRNAYGQQEKKIQFFTLCLVKSVISWHLSSLTWVEIGLAYMKV